MRMLEDPLIEFFPGQQLGGELPTRSRTSGICWCAWRAPTRMGVAYTLKNTRQAAAIFQEVYPQVVPTGLAPGGMRSTGHTTLLKTVSEKWTLDKPARQWGESDLKIYQSYIDWLVRAKILKQPMDAKEIATNDLIGDINKNLDVKSAEEASAR